MKKHKSLTALSCIACFIYLAATAYGQKIWEKKPYQEWTMSDVMKILNDSPWAQTQVENEYITYETPANSYSAIIRLRSALPVRQALLRQKQLLMNYDKFSPADKARFDNETKEFLECSDCAKYYVVTLGSPVFSHESTPNSKPKYVFDIVRTLKDLSLNELKPYVHLENDKGGRRELVHFVPPKREGAEAMFVFERLDSRGEPLISLENKKFFFKIDEKLFEKRSVPLKKFTFEVTRLVKNGAVIF